MNEVWESLATVATGLFAGASLYINLVEHPARLECGTAAAAAQWAPSYRRATVMQVALALVGSAAGLMAWLSGSGSDWLRGGLLLFSVVPFTLLVILPTNSKLLEPGRNTGSDETLRLLMRWGRLHAVRTILSLSGFVVFAVGGAR